LTGLQSTLPQRNVCFSVPLTHSSFNLINYAIRFVNSSRAITKVTLCLNGEGLPPAGFRLIPESRNLGAFRKPDYIYARIFREGRVSIGVTYIEEQNGYEREYAYFSLHSDRFPEGLRVNMIVSDVLVERLGRDPDFASLLKKELGD